MDSRSRTRLRRGLLAGVLVGIFVGLTGASSGCAALTRWGNDWADLGEPLKAWGSEIVGYREPVY